MTPSTNPGEPSAGAVRAAKAVNLAVHHKGEWVEEYEHRLALIIDRETGIGEAREALVTFIHRTSERADYSEFIGDTNQAAFLRELTLTAREAIAKLEA
jgi:hypothetical protein